VTLIGPLAEVPQCLGAPNASRLHLSFNDIVEPTEGLTLPGADHIDELIGFCRGWDRASPLLIHCWAGISRSTAAAFIAATDRLGPGSEAALAQALREASPTAFPNRRMIALADAALGRGGAMTGAINAIGRGVEAPAGTVFELKF
jgi:predicted protein tyrosine phosphatase